MLRVSSDREIDIRTAAVDGVGTDVGVEVTTEKLLTALLTEGVTSGCTNILELGFT